MVKSIDSSCKNKMVKNVRRDKLRDDLLNGCIGRLGHLHARLEVRFMDFKKSDETCEKSAWAFEQKHVP